VLEDLLAVVAAEVVRVAAQVALAVADLLASPGSVKNIGIWQVLHSIGSVLL
jgi:hypothetical protein